VNDERSFGRICNPTALNISIFNAKKENNEYCGLQIRSPYLSDCKSDRAQNNGTQPVPFGRI
jgi:hypothetical protein